jgi:DNA-binding transcriptional LysR family regulator
MISVMFRRSRAPRLFLCYLPGRIEVSEFGFSQISLGQSQLNPQRQNLNVFAEVDDMTMLRLLARDSRCVALIPHVVVQDELRSGVLEDY